MRRTKLTEGFSVVEAILVVLIVAALGLGGWYAWHRSHKTNKPATTASHATSTGATKASSSSSSTSSDPYAGWKTAVSPRAKFSIKYPASWTYAEAVGQNDNVEHITIDSGNFLLSIDSYQGKDPANGGIAATTCTDCVQTVGSTPISIPNLGSASIDTVTYHLDSGAGNALILRLADGTYYIPSSDATDVYTSFRGISNLASEPAYQQESSAQFESNADFATAEKILESVTY